LQGQQGPDGFNVKAQLASATDEGKSVQVGGMIFKNDVLNVDPAARVDARVVQVWIDLDDAAPVERMTNLTVDVLIDTSCPKTAGGGSVSH
jgi:hypothetical protein